MKIPAYHETRRWATVAPLGIYLGDFYTRERPLLGYLGQASSTSPSPAAGSTLTVAQVIQAVNPSHQYPQDSQMEQAIQGGQLTPGYNVPSECAQAGQGTGTASKAEIASGAAVMKLAAATGPAAPFVAVGGAILSLIGAITGHHAQAVANEQTILCQAVPATNAALAQVISEVQGGTVTPAQGVQYLGQILSAFQSAVSPITKSCNESCGLVKELQGIVQYLGSQFSVMSVQSGGSSLSVPGVGAIPTWALYAAAAAAVFFLMGD